MTPWGSIGPGTYEVSRSTQWLESFDSDSWLGGKVWATRDSWISTRVRLELELGHRGVLHARCSLKVHRGGWYLLFLQVFFRLRGGFRCTKSTAHPPRSVKRHWFFNFFLIRSIFLLYFASFTCDVSTEQYVRRNTTFHTRKSEKWLQKHTFFGF